MFIDFAWQQYQIHQILANSYRYCCEAIAKTKLCNHIAIGCELEFYVFASLVPLIPANTQQLQYFSSCKAEQGDGQLELIIECENNIVDLANKITIAKSNIYRTATANNLWACFAGKPKLNDCGSALQFSLSLIGDISHDLHQSRGEKIMQAIAINLLRKTNKNMLVLNLFRDDFIRFSWQENMALFAKQKNTAPVNLSFGNNNRSCAIRFATINSGNQCTKKRLEYRVASSAANHYLVLAFILLVIADTLYDFAIDDNFFNQDCWQKFGPIFGNSFDKQYNLTALQNNFYKAWDDFLLTDFMLKNADKII